jgi:hypothetical protein
LASLLVSITLILLGVGIKSSLAGWTVPQEWIENARSAYPDEPIEPLSLSGQISSAAIFFGLSAGGLWLNSCGGFSVRGAWWKLLARYVIGLVGILIIWGGLGAIFSAGEDVLAFVLRFIRYSLAGLWITALAPLLFRYLRLAQRSH